MTDADIDPGWTPCARVSNHKSVRRAAKTMRLRLHRSVGRRRRRDIPDSRAEGLSHEIGAGQLIEGLDDAIVSLSRNESKTFTTRAGGRDHAGKEADVTVTVKSIKGAGLPDADDDFAQLASRIRHPGRAALPT